MNKFISVFLVLCLTVLSGCGSNKEINTSIPQQQSAKQEPVVSVTENTKENTQVQKDTVHIPGISSHDVKISLEKLKFSFTGPRGGNEVFLDTGQAIDPDTGVELSCTLTEDTPLYIRSITFTADGTSVAGSLQTKNYFLVAEGFLAYCAILPYDGSEPEKAKSWVQNNIKKVKTGHPISTTIGEVELELSGSEYFHVLQMRRKAIK